MTTWYLDTSAALKLVLAEAESSDLIETINARRPTLVSSYLLETEMRRAAHRAPSITQRHATALLDRVDLYEVSPAVFIQAGLLPGAHLRSLDALHVASAISIGVDGILTYDARMVEVCRDLGIPVLAPGGPSSGGARPPSLVE